jgi:hypothetical protein
MKDQLETLIGRMVEGGILFPEAVNEFEKRYIKQVQDHVKGNQSRARSPCFKPAKLTRRSRPDIGRRFGGRDHTTVLHACRRIDALRKMEPVLQQGVGFLRTVLGRASRI